MPEPADTRTIVVGVLVGPALLGGLVPVYRWRQRTNSQELARAYVRRSLARDARKEVYVRALQVVSERADAQSGASPPTGRRWSLEPPKPRSPGPARRGSSGLLNHPPPRLEAIRDGDTVDLRPATEDEEVIAGRRRARERARAEKALLAEVAAYRQRVGPAFSPRDAEHLVARIMKAMGARKVRVTKATGDRGRDVEARGYVAEVKLQAQPVQERVVQQIYGVGQSMGCQALCFSLSGFRPNAVDFANRNGVLLFRFTTDGRVEPLSKAAQQAKATGL